MTGITPPALTFSGRCVDWPPIIRRPTTRLAYCTGMRRSPRSTSTMKATTAIIIGDDDQDLNRRSSRRMTNTLLVHLVDRVRQSDHDAGEDDQRHAVADTAFGDLLAQPHDECRAGRQAQHRHQDERRMPGFRTKPPSEFCSMLGDTEGLHHGQADGQVAGPLGDLAAAEFAFLLQFLERRDDDGQQLKNDRRRDVRHDAQRKDRQPPERTAARTDR